MTQGFTLKNTGNRTITWTSSVTFDAEPIVVVSNIPSFTAPTVVPPSAMLGVGQSLSVQLSFPSEPVTTLATPVHVTISDGTTSQVVTFHYADGFSVNYGTPDAGGLGDIDLGAIVSGPPLGFPMGSYTGSGPESAAVPCGLDPCAGISPLIIESQSPSGSTAFSLNLQCSASSLGPSLSARVSFSGAAAVGVYTATLGFTEPVCHGDRTFTVRARVP
jgi:hypothetical protein